MARVCCQSATRLRPRCQGSVRLGSARNRLKKPRRSCLGFGVGEDCAMTAGSVLVTTGSSSSTVGMGSSCTTASATVSSMTGKSGADSTATDSAPIGCSSTTGMATGAWGLLTGAFNGLSGAFAACRKGSIVGTGNFVLRTTGACATCTPTKGEGLVNIHTEVTTTSVTAAAAAKRTAQRRTLRWRFEASSAAIRSIISDSCWVSLFFFITQYHLFK